MKDSRTSEGDENTPFSKELSDPEAQTESKKIKHIFILVSSILALLAAVILFFLAKSRQKSQIFACFNITDSDVGKNITLVQISDEIMEDLFIKITIDNNISIYSEKTYSFNIPGIHNLTIQYSGELTTMDFFFNNSIYLSSFNFSQAILQNIKSMHGTFMGCSNLTSVDFGNIDTSQVSNMESLFSGCSNLESLNLTMIKTNQVTNFGGMFSGCSKITSLDLSNFQTSKVTNMSNMFNGCSSLTFINIINFSSNNHTDVNYMFENVGKKGTIIYNGSILKNDTLESLPLDWNRTNIST